MLGVSVCGCTQLTNCQRIQENSSEIEEENVGLGSLGLSSLLPNTMPSA